MGRQGVPRARRTKQSHKITREQGNEQRYRRATAAAAAAAAAAERLINPRDT